MGINTTEVQLDKLRHFKFDHNALADLDLAMYNASGKGMTETFMDVDEKKIQILLSSFWLIRLVVWTGLKWEDSSLMPENIGKLMEAETAESFKDITEKAWTAFMTSQTFTTMLPGGEDTVKKLEMAAASQ